MPIRRLARHTVACCLFACSIFIAAATAQAQRLPNTVLPQHYSLTLTPDLKAATFTGSESIDITLAEPTSSITLNAHDLTFQSVKISAQDKEQTASVSLDKEKEQATFTVPNQIPSGKATLKIEYSGILNGELFNRDGCRTVLCKGAVVKGKKINAEVVLRGSADDAR